MENGKIKRQKSNPILYSQAYKASSFLSQVVLPQVQSWSLEEMEAKPKLQGL